MVGSSGPNYKLSVALSYSQDPTMGVPSLTSPPAPTYEVAEPVKEGSLAGGKEKVSKTEASRETGVLIILWLTSAQLV